MMLLAHAVARTAATRQTGRKEENMGWVLSEPQQPELSPFRPTGRPPRGWQLAHGEPLHVPPGRSLVASTGTLASESGGEPGRHRHGGSAAKAPQTTPKVPQRVALVDLSGPELQHSLGHKPLGVYKRRHRGFRHGRALPFHFG